MEKRLDYKITISRIFLICGFLLIWEILGRSGKISLFYTSMPSLIFKDLLEFILSGDLYKHGKVTLYEAFLGLTYGSIIGVITGLILTQFSFLGKLLKPIITAIHGIPQLTLAPVYILWFGIGLSSKVFLAGLMVFFNVFFATYNGILSMEQKLIESANLLGASKIQTLRLVVVPTCLPWIIMGIRTGVGSSLVGAIVGEYMGASAGFGWMISYATSYFNIKRVMSCIIILLLVGLGMNGILNKIELLAIKWRTNTSLNVGENN